MTATPTERLFADADGDVIDGDQVLAASALAMQRAGNAQGRRGRRDGDVEPRARASRCATRHRARPAAQVGDRYVLEEMERRGAIARGEQSGHVIFRRARDDGRRAAHGGALPARWRPANGVSVGELARAMLRYPQVLINVPL